MSKTTTMNKVYEELKRIEKNMLTKEQIIKMLETFEIISNEHTIEQIRKSAENVRLHKVKEIRTISDI